MCIYDNINDENVYRYIFKEIVASQSAAPLIATWHFSLKIDIYCLLVSFCHDKYDTNGTDLDRVYIDDN